MAGIIWVASYPKSGNTWLRAFLHNLMRNNLEPHDINRLDDLVASTSSRGWYDEAYGASTSDLSEEKILALRPAAHKVLACRSNEDQFVKSHSLMGYRSEVNLTTPSLSAGAIYIVRNPLDVAVSAADHFAVSIDEMIERMADPEFRTGADSSHVAEYIGDWSAHVDGWAGEMSKRLLVLRYEDLLATPRQEFKKVCAFLGLRPPRQRLERAISFSSFKTLQAQEQTAGFKERAPHARAFFRSGKAGAWGESLSQEQQERICADHQQVMQRYGYFAASPKLQNEQLRRTGNQWPNKQKLDKAQASRLPTGKQWRASHA